MAYVNNFRAGTLSFTDRFGGIVNSFRAYAARRRIYNQTMRELSNLSDRDLSDLGISRYAIRDLAAEAAYGK